MIVRAIAVASCVGLSGCFPGSPHCAPENRQTLRVPIADGHYAATGDTEGTLIVKGDFVTHTYVDSNGDEIEIVWEITETHWPR